MNSGARLPKRHVSTPTAPNPNADDLEDKLDKPSSYTHGLRN